MRVCLPDDYQRKLTAVKDRRDLKYAQLEIPELKEYRPRKRLGEEVLEQEVYGIDPYTKSFIRYHAKMVYAIMEEICEMVLLRVLSEKVRDFTGSGNTPMEYPLQNVVERMIEKAEKAADSLMRTLFQGVLKALQSRQSTDKYVAIGRGLELFATKSVALRKMNLSLSSWVRLLHPEARIIHKAMDVMPVFHIGYA